MWKCTKCNEYRFGNVIKCNCQPFTIIDEDGEEHEIYGISEEDAALKYAEESNVEGEYYLMNESVTIEVNSKKFVISAEPDIHYSAREVPEDK